MPDFTDPSTKKKQRLPTREQPAAFCPKMSDHASQRQFDSEDSIPQCTH